MNKQVNSKSNRILSSEELMASIAQGIERVAFSSPEAKQVVRYNRVILGNLLSKITVAINSTGNGSGTGIENINAYAIRVGKNWAIDLLRSNECRVARLKREALKKNDDLVQKTREELTESLALEELDKVITPMMNGKRLTKSQLKQLRTVSELMKGVGVKSLMGKFQVSRDVIYKWKQRGIELIIDHGNASPNLERYLSKRRNSQR